MKPVVRISAGRALACSLLASTANAAPPAPCVACAACHSSDGTNGLGPSIKGVYGRKAGTAKGFTYSAALKKAGVTWERQVARCIHRRPRRRRSPAT